MPKSTRQRAHPQGTSAQNQCLRPHGWRMAHDAAPDLSHAARARLDMLDWHEGHGRNVSRTARHLGFSRPTVYRWLSRYDRRRLETLENRTSRPLRRRRPSWTLAELAAVRTVRLRYPRWGKDKLVVLLAREGVVLSTSMVGRILERLRHSGELHEPLRRRISARKRTWRRPYAVRKPAGFVASEPGDLVQVDTVDVRPLPSLVLKQFTARDVVSRWDVLELAGNATARSAVRILDALSARMPSGSRPSASTTAQSSWPILRLPARAGA